MLCLPDEQIFKVKTNIRNMINFNNYLNTQGNTKILNAYMLLSLSDNRDLGLQIGLNLLCGAYHNYVTKKGVDKSYYLEYQNNIGTGVTTFSDGHLNDSACAYLFIDTFDNVVINPNGLFHRKYVFNNLPNINHTIKYYSNLQHNNK